MAPTDSAPRIDSIDLLRGFVMVVMVLDHARDFVSPAARLPEQLTDPGAALFLTRWITHLCAPVFVVLAGVGAYYYGMRQGRKAASWFLVSRGLWLIVLEFTVIAFGWTGALPLTPFGPFSSFTVLIVIWALGVSMIVLGLLVWLPRWAILLCAAPLVLGHDFLHFLPVEQRLLAAPGFRPVTAGWDQLWAVLHVSNQPLAFGNAIVFVVYPLIPWVPLMALAYATVPSVFEPDSRTRRCLTLGLTLTAGFVALRFLWPDLDRLSPFDGDGWIDFLNTQKYPPSLQYLLMTLGPALLLIAFFDRVRGTLVDWLLVFGRVPLFFYITHIFVVHALGALWVGIQHDVLFLDIRNPPTLENPPGLPAVYLVWAATIVLLYRPCRWFMELKRRRRDLAWLSYL